MFSSSGGQSFVQVVSSVLGVTLVLFLSFTPPLDIQAQGQGVNNTAQVYNGAALGVWNQRWIQWIVARPLAPLNTSSNSSAASNLYPDVHIHTGSIDCNSLVLNKSYINKNLL